ncbi:hypothetical protein ACFU98_36830 [Streptomyces sp. NPDC057575]|uniref:hypothetical protein n=1 Tax=unclassified Streptomyces TaxID=2593676 RepID=UPI00367CCFD8
MPRVLPVPENALAAAGARTEARRAALEEIDQGWCPAWDTGWQRCFRLIQNLLQDGTRTSSTEP